mgnify:CR=1 FL=1
MARPKLTPQIALNLAWRLYEATGERDERLENMIAQDREVAYEFVADVLDFPEGSQWAYWYAKNVLKAPWPEAESIIEASPRWAYEYAFRVLNGPFLKAEPEIAESSKWAYAYARDVLETDEDHARFKEILGRAARY